MAAKSRFVDEMHPRSLPKEKKRFGQIAPAVPKPLLPGVSMIADKNGLSRAGPKRSFIKWKQQHGALFEPAAIKFPTTVQATPSLADKRKTVPILDTVDRKFDLDFRKLTSHQQQHGSHEEYQQSTHGCTATGDNNFPADAKRPEFQSKGTGNNRSYINQLMTFSQLNRVARSEATRCDVPRVDTSPVNPCGCRCVVPVAPSLQMSETKTEQTKDELDMQLVVELSEKSVVRKPNGALTKEALKNIVEEQIEIVQQQKNILMQQNEIFSLQYQIEKLLLTNCNLNNKSPSKQALPGLPIRKSITSSPSSQGNSAPVVDSGTSVVHCANSSPTTLKSIGLMTSFQSSNEAWSPNPSDSPEDTMLERINNIIRVSPPMINHRRTSGNGNCRVSPKQTDINFSSQTLIYKTSTRNNISANDPKIADRSFALHLLDMKYRPEKPTSAASPNSNRFQSSRQAIEKAKRSPLKCSGYDDFVPSNISPDKYDYMIRHGLLNKN